MLEAWREGEWVYVYVGRDGTDAARAVRRTAISFVYSGYKNEGCFYFLLPPPSAHVPQESIEMVLEELKPIARELLSFLGSVEGERQLSLGCVEKATELLQEAATLLYRIYGSRPFKTTIVCQLNESGEPTRVLADLVMGVE